MSKLSAEPAVREGTVILMLFGRWMRYYYKERSKHRFKHEIHDKKENNTKVCFSKLLFINDFDFFTFLLLARSSKDSIGEFIIGYCEIWFKILNRSIFMKLKIAVSVLILRVQTSPQMFSNADELFIALFLPLNYCKCLSFTAVNSFEKV